MIDINPLITKGILMVDGIKSPDELINLAKSIGQIALHPNGKKLAILNASNGEKSLPGTFSHTFGLNAFPFHTDTAFWALPARYVVMGMFAQSRSTTNYISVLDIAKYVSFDLLSQARKSIYLVETFEGSKYMSPAFEKKGKWGIRFDPNIMKPVNDHAKKFHVELEKAIENVGFKKIDWTGNKAVIFDNWIYLHGRSAVNGENREIYRIYLEN